MSILSSSLQLDKRLNIPAITLRDHKIIPEHIFAIENGKKMEKILTMTCEL